LTLTANVFPPSAPPPPPPPPPHGNSHSGTTPATRCRQFLPSGTAAARKTSCINHPPLNLLSLSVTLNANFTSKSGKQAASGAPPPLSALPPRHARAVGTRTTSSSWTVSAASSGLHPALHTSHTLTPCARAAADCNFALVVSQGQACAPVFIFAPSSRPPFLFFLLQMKTRSSNRHHHRRASRTSH
jgi:hypothetical protein